MAVATKTETGVTKNQIFNALAKSTHGALQEYIPIVQQAAKAEPEFLAHLISWNRDKGQVRDSKVAIPLISLSESNFDPEFIDNSFAHLATLAPRNLMEAWRLAKQVRLPGRMMSLKRLVRRYLSARETNIGWFVAQAVQHRHTLQELYRVTNTKPAPFADKILFKNQYVPGSRFDKIARLKDMGDAEAAATIKELKLPMLLISRPLGKRLKEPGLLMALIDSMSDSDIVNSQKWLEKLGVKNSPITRAAYEKALERASQSKKNVLKVSKAIEAVEDETLKKKLRNVQEKQIKQVCGIEGNWLVLGDCSGSMRTAIEVARHLAGTLTKMVTGDVHLIFFNTSPRYINATGKDYDLLLKETRHVVANGGTSIGCGVQYAMDKKLDIDGIAVVSDGGDNTYPQIHQVYPHLCKRLDKQVPVYLYRTQGDTDTMTGSMDSIGVGVEVFPIPQDFDYFSLPNLAQTMRVSRYSLIDEVLATPLLTLDQVFA